MSPQDKTSFRNTAAVSPATNSSSEEKNPSHLSTSLLVEVRAKSVRQTAPGVFAIELSMDRISEEHSKMLQELFPNLAEKAHEVLHDLLVKEALISSMMK